MPEIFPAKVNPAPVLAGIFSRLVLDAIITELPKREAEFTSERDRKLYGLVVSTAKSIRNKQTLMYVGTEALTIRLGTAACQHVGIDIPSMSQYL